MQATIRSSRSYRRNGAGALVAAAALLLAAAPAAAGRDKAQVCHRNPGTGGWNLIEVAEPAVPAHLAHGDHLILTFWPDLDGDGLGAGVSSQGCVVPPGFVENDADCDDTASSCTTACGDTDGDGRPACKDRCHDADGDGWGADTTGDVVGVGPYTVGQCTTDGATPCDLGPACLGPDCNDADPAINPAATEVCDMIDNDCDALVDDADPGVVGQPTWYADTDGDGYGDPAAPQLACFQPSGYVADSTDCDDGDAAVHPGASEVCNHLDDDCDGLVDDDDPGVTGQSTWFEDGDGDGYGDPGSSQQACFQPSGYVANDDDCDDGDAAVKPGAAEVCNGVDDNCNGSTDEGGVCTAKRVFVSSALYTGNFGNGQRVLGYLNADAACQTLASNAGLGGTWKAWLSGRPDSAGCGPLQPDCDGHGAADRFTHNPGPYNLVNGTKVADSWTDLTDGSLDHAIDVTEVNTAVGAEHRVWTNTTTGGAAWDASTNCASGPTPDPPYDLFTWSCGAPSWTAGDCQFQSGKWGDATSTTGSWTGTVSSNNGCDLSLHIYCFEQ